MSWNYRILKFGNTPDEPYYEIYEVYYGEDGIPHSWAESHNLLACETVEELIGAYENIGSAFSKPVLEFMNGKLIEVKD